MFRFLAGRQHHEQHQWLHLEHGQPCARQERGCCADGGARQDQKVFSSLFFVPPRPSSSFYLALPWRPVRCSSRPCASCDAVLFLLLTFVPSFPSFFALRLKGKISEYKRYREVMDKTLKKLKLDADALTEERDVLLEENDGFRKRQNVQNRQLKSVFPAFSFLKEVPRAPPPALFFVALFSLLSLPFFFFLSPFPLSLPFLASSSSSRWVSLSISRFFLHGIGPLLGFLALLFLPSLRAHSFPLFPLSFSSLSPLPPSPCSFSSSLLSCLLPFLLALFSFLFFPQPTLAPLACCATLSPPSAQCFTTGQPRQRARAGGVAHCRPRAAAAGVPRAQRAGGTAARQQQACPAAQRAAGRGEC